ncbi:MAG: polyprenyl synthetase family protein [Chloroflexi bacterium]|nr:polyprenyl synthetase family protein [Chloroflexota bacterium]
MARLDETFDRLLPVVDADLQTALTPADNPPPQYYHMMHYHMGWVNPKGELDPQNTGKRLRPLICLLCAEGVSGAYKAARPAAAAVELIHNFSLIHDDVQDKSPTRRGRPTVWNVWGEEQAINAGDAMFAMAQLAIFRVQSVEDWALAARQLFILNETCVSLTTGQHLDMLFEAQDLVTPEAYLDMIRGKTAALLSAACYMGALAARAAEETANNYRLFGEHLGMAFQVIDDVLDIWGSPEQTGKRAAHDIHQRKKSLPVVYGLTHSLEMRELYAQQGELDEATAGHIVSLLDDLGARDYAEQMADDYSQKTLDYLQRTEARPETYEILSNLVDYLLKRQF